MITLQRNCAVFPNRCLSIIPHIYTYTWRKHPILRDLIQNTRVVARGIPMGCQLIAARGRQIERLAGFAGRWRGKIGQKAAAR